MLVQPIRLLPADFRLARFSHKLSHQNRVVNMADDVDKMNLAFDRVLESFKLKNLKDSQRDALEKLVGVKMCSLFNQRGRENH